MADTTLTCGHEPTADSFTPGYGEDTRGNRYCYACCADRDKAAMIRDGRATLYLSKGESGWIISNWPGSLRFGVRATRRGRHNMAGTRYDAWFIGPDLAPWHAVQYGENSQIAHCKRIKSHA